MAGIELVAAMDVSGDPSTGNHKFLGIVIGTRYKIGSIISSMGYDGSHMGKLKNKEIQQRIISRIRFDGNESTAFCIRIDKNNTVKELIQTKASKNKTVLRKRIHATFNRSVMHYIRQDIEEFLIRHKHSMRDVVFECDSDCLDIAKDNGLRHGAAGSVHRLADAVAWANNRNIESLRG